MIVTKIMIYTTQLSNTLLQAKTVAGGPQLPYLMKRDLDRAANDNSDVPSSPLAGMTVISPIPLDCPNQCA
jgi:hypothetical protein